jgi:hypothetical protein
MSDSPGSAAMMPDDVSPDDVSPPDLETLRSGLMAALDVAQWDWLRPHAQREGVIMVTAAMDLVEVGMAIATDNTASVQRWIDEQAIYKPTQQQLSAWNQTSDLEFEALIVAPFVLLKEPAIA